MGSHGIGEGSGKINGSVFFFDLEILQGRELAAQDRSLTTAGPLIEILAALGTESAALIIAQGVQWNIDHHLLLNSFGQINLFARKRDQSQFFGAQLDLALLCSHLLLTGTEGNSEINGEGLAHPGQAAAAGQFDPGFNVPFDLDETTCQIGTDAPSDRAREVSFSGLVDFLQRGKEIRIFFKIENDLTFFELLQT